MPNDDYDDSVITSPYITVASTGIRFVSPKLYREENHASGGIDICETIVCQAEYRSFSVEELRLIDYRNGLTVMQYRSGSHVLRDQPYAHQQLSPFSNGKLRSPPRHHL
jgi:hypothetical protein